MQIQMGSKSLQGVDRRWECDRSNLIVSSERNAITRILDDESHPPWHGVDHSIDNRILQTFPTVREDAHPPVRGRRLKFLDASPHRVSSRPSQILPIEPVPHSLSVRAFEASDADSISPFFQKTIQQKSESVRSCNRDDTVVFSEDESIQNCFISPERRWHRASTGFRANSPKSVSLPFEVPSETSLESSSHLSSIAGCQDKPHRHQMLKWPPPIGDDHNPLKNPTVRSRRSPHFLNHEQQNRRTRSDKKDRQVCRPSNLGRLFDFRGSHPCAGEFSADRVDLLGD